MSSLRHPLGLFMSLLVCVTMMGRPQIDGSQADEMKTAAAPNSRCGRFGACRVTAAPRGAQASKRLWKDHRAAAIETMIGMNVGYSMAVARNVRVAGQRLQ